MENKKIPLKNYIILLVSICVTILAVFYMRGWYLTTEEYYNNHSVISDITSEIKTEEIINYATDNPDFILYVASGKNTEIKDFERSLKKFISKNDLENNVLYLNLDNNLIDEFNSSLSKMTADGVSFGTVDYSGNTFYIFNNSKVEKILNTKSLDRLKIVFQGYGFIEND